LVGSNNDLRERERQVSLEKWFKNRETFFVSQTLSLFDRIFTLIHKKSWNQIEIFVFRGLKKNLSPSWNFLEKENIAEGISSSELQQKQWKIISLSGMKVSSEGKKWNSCVLKEKLPAVIANWLFSVVMAMAEAYRFW
jgi:hypothetical protein